jgi:prepilin-type N-terminal cleavage/methylation domain-containing protein
MKISFTKRQRAFTLLELIITLVLFATLMVIVAPAWDNFRRSQAAASAANEFCSYYNRLTRECIQMEATGTLIISINLQNVNNTYYQMNTSSPYGMTKKIMVAKNYHGTTLEGVGYSNDYSLLNVTPGGQVEISPFNHMTHFSPGGEEMSYYVVRFRNKTHCWDVRLYDDGHASVVKQAYTSYQFYHY